MISILLVMMCGLLSYLVAFLVQHLARRAQAIDRPTGGRKIHRQPIPLWGGLGIFGAFGAMCLVAWQLDLFHFSSIRTEQLIGFFVALGLLILVGCLDDRFDLPVGCRLSFYVVACLIIITTGTGMVNITHWSGQGAFSLVWFRSTWSVLGHVLTISWPADVLTLVWLLLVTFATKFMDGLDGLVTGQTVIGSVLMILLTLSAAYYQPDVALLIALFGAAFLGFLPHNIHPAKQFLGEGGSVIAGFSLGVLAILSGAKVAMALAVLTIPIVDLLVVFYGRLRRGVPLWKGDDTHLHFRLLKAGLSHKMTVVMLWSISAGAGLLALTLQTRGKVFLLIGLALMTVLASWIAHRWTLRRPL